MAASNAFTLPRLKMMVESLLGYAIDDQNACCILPVSRLYDAKMLEVQRTPTTTNNTTQHNHSPLHLQDSCLFFIVKNLRKVKESDAWKDLEAEQRSEILKRQQRWKLSGKWEHFA